MRVFPLSLLSLAITVPALAQTPDDVADLIGARGAGGEAELQRRGYVFVRTQEGDDRKWSNWWHPARRQCLSVVTMDGRYASIVTTPGPDCDQSADGRPAKPVLREDDHPRPDIGFRPPAPRTTAPSYAGATAAEVVQDYDLGLICFGDGQRPQVASSGGWTWNSRDRRYDYGTRVDLTQEHFDASLMLQIGAGEGRIRLPKKLIPPIHSRGQDGWWTLDDVSIGSDTITASYRLNGLNKPRLTVDRRSGRITVVGAADYAFRGICEAAESEPRKF